MIFELVFNAALVIFFIYCFFYVGITTPDNTAGQLDGAQWSQGLLAILVILLIVNIIKIIKNKDNVKTKVVSLNIKDFITNKLFIGIVLLLVYSLALSRTGFLLTSFILVFFYSYLLGEKRVIRMILTSALSVIVLYLLFNRALDIMLPRGTGIFRTFALFIESL
ncbi:MAG: tripartite tricarboxylate transporter TctB family protein [Eubacteriales bacterium]|nr:tripartite tricarboxylate transporter TctB family protein [Eubacteriales bacterium]